LTEHMADLRPSVGRAFYGQFARLRPAQAAAVEACASGDDIIVLAGTGSGKTEAVVAPLVSRYLADLAKADRPVIMYVAPTRALVNDVLRRLDGPFDLLGLRLGARHGERNDLARASKPAVVITTPESCDVMLFKSPGLLSLVRAVVIDEAHLLYNTQRGLQLALLIRRLELLVGRSVQVAAMSATVADGVQLAGDRADHQAGLDHTTTGASLGRHPAGSATRCKGAGVRRVAVRMRRRGH
jgi:ATP-dependent Lhr-like helicase